MKLFLIILSLILMKPLTAEELKIAAIVGKEPITMLDYEERLIFTIATSGMQNTTEIRKQVGPRVLDAMIEEKLKLQEAKKFHIAVSDLDIKREWDRIEQQNNVQDGQIQNVILQLNLRPNVFRDQLRADIAWIKYISARYRPTVTVSESELKRALETRRQQKDPSLKTKGEPGYKIRQLFMPISGKNPSDRASCKRTLDAMRRQIKSADDILKFQRELGGLQPPERWVKLSEFDAPIQKEIKKLSLLQTTPPVEIDQGYSVIMVCEKNEQMDAATELKEQLKEEIMSTKLHMLARRHLRDLKHVAHIDKRV